MSQTRRAGDWRLEDMLAVTRRIWGFDRLRPMQEAAIRAGLERHDSLVVLPTGGGKSLCYQVPAALAERTDIVVSPLISLMKDQVDGLRACGYPAAALYSGLSSGEVRKIEREIADGRYRLIFAAPERVVTDSFLRMIERLGVRSFAIDEAHCISHLGHDFRPEYRQLALLKQRFTDASVHAYTATATQRVQRDIVEQLRLADPTVLVGTCDRPNLVYRILPRLDVDAQVLEAVRRHNGQAVIVYCISRKDTEAMAAFLRYNGVRAAHYHAGMEKDERRQTQDAFAEEKLDVVVATVAFGMGIDRSDVRCVVHAAMPKSIEHYQQETGRAGRDGLEAECVLFYSAADAFRWESLIGKSTAATPVSAEVVTAMVELLEHMRRYCTAAMCRHKMLSEYFGQPYQQASCGACDLCLNEVESVEDPTVTAQKILSCVARVGEKFGVGHVVEVLVGANTDRIHQLGHDRLSTYGLLKDTSRETLTAMIYQLIDEGVLERTSGDRPVLTLNEASWEVMRGQREVRLVQTAAAGVKRTRVEEVSWEGVDAGLFEALRGLLRELAERRGVPPLVIFGDAALRDMARIRPSSPESFLRVTGVGHQKMSDFGSMFIEMISNYCRQHGLTQDVFSSDDAQRRPPRQPSAGKQAAFELFAKGASVEEVMTRLKRARSTTFGYLAEFVATSCPDRLDHWVTPETYRTVAQAVDHVDMQPLKPIFERLGGRVPYEEIRLVLTHLRARVPTANKPTLQ